MSTTFFDIFKKNFYSIFIVQMFDYILLIYSSFQNRTYVRLSVKWENTEFSYMGGSKNQNKRSVFRATYRLVHLHTNLILKHFKKSLKNSRFPNFSPQNQISSCISLNPTKINTFITLATYFKTKIQITFFLYKYKNHKKILYFSDC